MALSREVRVCACVCYLKNSTKSSSSHPYQCLWESPDPTPLSELVGTNHRHTVPSLHRSTDEIVCKSEAIPVPLICWENGWSCLDQLPRKSANFCRGNDFWFLHPFVVVVAVALGLGLSLGLFPIFFVKNKQISKGSKCCRCGLDAKYPHN